MASYFLKGVINMKYEDKAVELFNQGYNCAQAVFTAFNDILPIDDVTSLKLTATFGGGIAGLGDICGALSGAILVLSFHLAPADFSDKVAKSQFYEKMASIIQEFQQEHGARDCRDLLEALKDNPPHPSEKRCTRYVRSAANLVVRHLPLAFN